MLVGQRCTYSGIPKFLLNIKKRGGWTGVGPAGGSLGWFVS
jgi:hypothetical protein